MSCAHSLSLCFCVRSIPCIQSARDMDPCKRTMPNGQAVNWFSKYFHKQWTARVPNALNAQCSWMSTNCWNVFPAKCVVFVFAFIVNCVCVYACHCVAFAFKYLLAELPLFCGARCGEIIKWFYQIEWDSMCHFCRIWSVTEPPALAISTFPIMIIPSAASHGLHTR